MMKKNIYTLSVAALFALSVIIAGCGGGGGTPVAPSGNEELKEIEAQIQSQGAKWVAKENPISRLSDADFMTLLGSLPEEPPSDRISRRVAEQQLPASIDWRNHQGSNWLSSMKQQGSCGSCVAFAAIAVQEAMTRIINNDSALSIDLSEAELYLGSDRTCPLGSARYGWFLFEASRRLMNMGAVDEPCLQYEVNCEGRPECQCYDKCVGAYDLTAEIENVCSDNQSRLQKIKSYSWIRGDTAEETRNFIKTALQDGPVLTQMAVYKDFAYYGGKPYRHVHGDFTGNHAVVIIGYSDADEAWLARNSWGSAWGVGGYFMIEYGEAGIEDSVIAFSIEESDLQPPEDNNAPDISDNSASESTPGTVIFSLKYKDADNDAPEYVRVFVNGTAHNMIKAVGNDYVTGVNYTVTVSGLSQGSHSYYFMASDGTDTTRAPASGSYSVKVTSSDDGDGIVNNEWLTIPSGEFIMGCASADTQCQGDESPKHVVAVSEYKIQKYQVTNAQYKACVDAGTCTAPSNSSSYTRSSYYGNSDYDNYPVIYVDWNRATTYCSWIGGRLPTEAEWEKASRGPSPREPIYPWGDSATNCTVANYSGCVGDTSKVGSYPLGASYYGVMDMTGNVWEWVNDWYASDYYSTGGPTWNNPQGPASGSYRAMRGGAWFVDSQSFLRLSYRIGNYPTHADLLDGFRCAQGDIQSDVLQSISVSPTSVSVEKGSTSSLTVSCTWSIAGQAACPTLSWTSTNTSLATVSSQGVVTGVNAGSSTVTASASGVTSNGVSVTVTDSGGDIVSNEWITIPGGVFVMGCASADMECYGEEKPKHVVTVATYKMLKYPVTNAQYKTCVDAEVCLAPRIFNSKTRTPYFGNAAFNNYPVIYISLDQAKTYCEWIGGRLPTEAEWEKAARGPSPSENIYPWGDSAANCAMANYKGCLGDTSEVTSHPSGASFYGVVDMVGNVWEWVEDDWHWDYSGAPTDGSAWIDNPRSNDRVLRGGSWNHDAKNVRVTNRLYSIEPTDGYNTNGIRCAQD